MSAAGKRYARAAVEAALDRAGVAAVEELSKEIVLFQLACYIIVLSLDVFC